MQFCIPRTIHGETLRDQPLFSRLNRAGVARGGPKRERVRREDAGERRRELLRELEDRRVQEAVRREGTFTNRVETNIQFR